MPARPSTQHPATLVFPGRPRGDIASRGGSPRTRWRPPWGRRRPYATGRASPDRWDGNRSASAAAAVIGRLGTGFVDRLNRRRVSSATLVIQIIGLTLLGWAPSAVVVYAGCALFGLGVGNLTTLPGLILAVEWPREHFSALVGLVVGINQFTFAFGPSLVGILRDWAGTYGLALGVCSALQAAGAAMILLGPGRDRSPVRRPRRSTAL